MRTETKCCLVARQVTPHIRFAIKYTLARDQQLQMRVMVAQGMYIEMGLLGVSVHPFCMRLCIITVALPPHQSSIDYVY